MQRAPAQKAIAIALLIALPGAAATPATAATAAEAPRSSVSIPLQHERWNGDLDGMIKRRAIRVLVPYSKTLYFVDLGGTQRGMSYDFMRAFEDSLNKDLGRGNVRVHAVFIPVSRAQLLPYLLEGKGDVVAANLTITPERSKQVDFTMPAAQGVAELIITGPGAPKLARLDDLSGRSVYVSRATSYYENLLALNKDFSRRKLPQMRLQEAPGHFETEDVLEMVNAGLVSIAVADGYLAKLWREVYPNLRVNEDLALHENGDIAFAVRKNSPQLKARLDSFIRTHKQGTTFGNITLRRYLSDVRWVKNAVSQGELQKFERLVDLFRKYGARYDVDWLLLAAQGYQESQLDHSRRSAAGAIGIMQVLPATGREMQVGDVTQLEPNIHAGVKYVRFLVDRYFADQPMSALDRVLFAFASYNAGPARVRSLRKEAGSLGLDPNVWFDNVERVAAERVGRETVQYVSNIYKYYIAYKLMQDEVQHGLPNSQAAR